MLWTQYVAGEFIDSCCSPTWRDLSDSQLGGINDPRVYSVRKIPVEYGRCHTSVTRHKADIYFPSAPLYQNKPSSVSERGTRL